MGKFSAITCDHCDARDIIESPPIHNIKNVKTTVIVDNEYSPAARQVETDLCEKCRDALCQEVFNLMTQVSEAS